MRRTEIELSAPFEESLASLLMLPSTLSKARLPDALISRKSSRGDAEVRDALHSLYEAAHGREVETQIGFIAVAPPAAVFLKGTPYRVSTQCEFFLEALARILVAGSPRENQAHGAPAPGRNRPKALSGDRRGPWPWPATCRRFIASAIDRHPMTFRFLLFSAAQNELDLSSCG